MLQLSWQVNAKSGVSKPHSTSTNNSNWQYLLNGIGIVEEAITGLESGRVKYQSIYWNAITLLDLIILPGTRVRVVDLDNTTLVVEPVNLD